MSKVSARGAHKVGSVVTDKGTSRHVYTLRSDGKVLTRLAGFYNDNGDYSAHATGYRTMGSLKLAEGQERYSFADVERLSKVLEGRGHKVREVKR